MNILFIYFLHIFLYTDTKPTLRELEIMPFGEKNINIIECLASDWKRVGILLDLNPARVDNIQSNCLPPRQVQKACTEMFREWIKEDNATWTALLELLVLIKEIRLASDLREALLS